MARPNGYLLDTNIIVALVRDNALGKYLDRTHLLTAGGNPFFVPFVVVGELQALALKWGWGTGRRARLATTLAHFTRLDLAGDPVLNAYADLDAFSASRGIDMGKNDLWIAAVAQVYDLTLLTADHDFDHLHAAGLIDVEWVDPNSK
jgi:predicted nucleic acid-binding protein